jgi:hypothetical protein
VLSSFDVQPLLCPFLELGHALDCLDGSVVRDNADKISLTFGFHQETSHCRRHLGEVEFGYTEVMSRPGHLMAWGMLVLTAQGVSTWPI